LADEPRPGGPRTVTDEQVETLVVATLEPAPKDATHWSRMSMAAETGLSKSTVGRIWKAFGLKPHQIDTFKLSNDPQFIDKVRDVVGLYLDPPEKAIVLCVDEKSRIQAFGPVSAGAADDAWHARAPQPRLRAPRQHDPVRRAGRGHRRSHLKYPDRKVRVRGFWPGIICSTSIYRRCEPNQYSPTTASVEQSERLASS
jgi:hypothetical protein